MSLEKPGSALSEVVHEKGNAKNARASMQKKSLLIKRFVQI